MLWYFSFKAKPVRRVAPGTLLEDACKVVKAFMARDPKELRFTILALAKTEEGGGGGGGGGD